MGTYFSKRMRWATVAGIVSEPVLGAGVSGYLEKRPFQTI